MAFSMTRTIERDEVLEYSRKRNKCFSFLLYSLLAKERNEQGSLVKGRDSDIRSKHASKTQARRQHVLILDQMEMRRERGEKRGEARRGREIESG